MSEYVNVGCGMTPTQGWKNYDNSWSIKLAKKPILMRCLKALGLLKSMQLEYIQFAKKQKIDWADATKNLPLADNSVEILYSSHMLEHLDRAKAEAFLKEAKRVLKPGGILRIVVPDLKILIDDYLQNGDADDFVERLYMHKDMPTSLKAKLKYLIIGDRQHQWHYDAASLSKLLEKLGYVNPVSLTPGQTTIENPEHLDLKEREEESLYIEAQKP